MQETYITLEEAARFEGIRYNTLIQRMKRSPAQYKTRTEAREGGGKELVLLSTASLSQKGRRAYRAHIRAMAEPEEGEAAPPWYVGADLNGYIEEHRKQYHKAVELAREVQGFLNYAGEDRTAYAEALAARLGISLGTLYRHGQSVMEANAWALRLEQADGHARDYFRTLALCRKPRERSTFPSLMTDPDVMELRPYWQYDAVNDSRTRPSHLAMDGRVFPADSPVWDTWFPPNGFKCRCTVRTLSKRQVERMGLQVETQLPKSGILEDGRFVNLMPDPHFATNPAKTPWRPDLEGYPEPLAKAFRAREKGNPTKKPQEAP